MNTHGDSFFSGYLFDMAAPRDPLLRALEGLVEWET